MSVDALITAISAYFRGERQEIYVILAYAAALVAIALIFFLVVRGSFARGLGGGLVAIAILGASIAVPLLLRDPKIETALAAAVKGDAATAAVGAETTRLDTVIAAYPVYRYLFAGLAVLAILVVLLTRNGLANGVAVAVFLLFATQLVIDHYSEERARLYRTQL